MQTIHTRRRPRRVHPRNARARVAAAFREMASGIAERTAYAATVAFYRSGKEWAKSLG